MSVNPLVVGAFQSIWCDNNSWNPHNYAQREFFLCVSSIKYHAFVYDWIERNNDKMTKKNEVAKKLEGEWEKKIDR